MPDESDERRDPDTPDGSQGDGEEPLRSSAESPDASDGEATDTDAGADDPDPESATSEEPDAVDTEAEEPDGDAADAGKPITADAAESSARAVETDGDGYAGDYVGDRLPEYDPSPPESFEDDRSELDVDDESDDATDEADDDAREADDATEEPVEDDDNWGGISTPPDDEEMPLADHIEEMILRLAAVLLIGAAGTAIGLLWASQAIDFIWADVIPGADERPPHLYHPLELWLTRIKLSALLGIMVALPMFVYQCYRFMRPGLYPHERKYYLAAVPTSVILAGLGMIFSYLIVLPILFAYFTFYSEGSAEIAYALGETFNLVITLSGFLAIVFQIPLFIMLAIMMGVTTRRWLAEKRLYFWVAFAGLSFMFTMDPTLMAPVFVAITMIILFEGTLLLLKWTGR